MNLRTKPYGHTRGSASLLTSIENSSPGTLLCGHRLLCRRIRYVILFICACFCFVATVTSLTLDEPLRNSAHRQAVRLAREGNFDQALQLMSGCLSEADPAPELLFDYIVILGWAGKYQDAVEAYEALGPMDNVPDYVLKEVARCYRFVGQYDRAMHFYQRYLEKNGNDRDALLGLTYTFSDASQLETVRKYLEGPGQNEKSAEKYKKVQEVVEKLRQKYPYNRAMLFLRAELLETQREYLAAYYLYDDLLRICPDKEAIKKLQYRALMNLGANSLVREKWERSIDAVEPQTRNRILLNLGELGLQSEEPEATLGIIEKSGVAPEVILTGGAKDDFAVKVQCQKIMALAQRQDMTELVAEYEKLGNVAGIPALIRAYAADAYFYLGRAREALRTCEEVLRYETDPRAAEARVIVSQVLINLGRYREAEEILAALDKAMPPRRVRRGVLRDNSLKEEIMLNRGWSLVYQDRLDEAQKYFRKYLSLAPFNGHIRTALAHIYLWRGWPRKALEEFAASRTLFPGSLPTESGYGYALHENGFGKEARSLARELGIRYPRERNIQKLNRYLDVENMRGVSFAVASVQENPGIRETDCRLRIDHPLGFQKNIFAEALYRDVAEDEISEQLRRGFAGFTWELSREVGVAAEVSANADGKKWGGSGTVRYSPSDYFSFTGFYNSYSLDVPLRARVFGIEAQESSLSMLYHHSESLMGEAKASFLKMSDDNDHWAYELKGDKALTTTASWKTWLGFEASLDSSARRDVDYFSPEFISAVYLVPAVEHVWYRRYERSLADRLSAGIGEQWQQDFPPVYTWYARYEQEWRFTDAAALQWLASYAKKDYDNIDTYVWDFTLKASKRF